MQVNICLLSGGVGGWVGECVVEWVAGWLGGRVLSGVGWRGSLSEGTMPLFSALCFHTKVTPETQ